MSASPKPSGRSPGAQHGGAVARVCQGGGVQDDVAVVGADVRGERVRAVRRGAQAVAPEVLGVSGEVDREGAHRALAGGGQATGGQGRDGRGVEPAGEQGAQRDVGDELLGNDVIEQFAHPLHRGGQVVGVVVGGERPVPVRGEPGRAHPQRVARPHLAHAAVDGVARGLGEGDQFGQALGVHGGTRARVGEDGLGLGAEEHAVGGRVVVERLDAHPVADQEQFPVARVPQGEGVHPVQPLGEAGAPLQVGAQHDLGVAFGTEGVAARAQLGAQLAVVVGLAAVREDQAGRAGRGDGHGLGAAGRVDDGEPAVAERGVRVEPAAAGVGASAGHGPRHGVEGGLFAAQVTVVGDPSGDSAHGRGASFGRPRPGWGPGAALPPSVRRSGRAPGRPGGGGRGVTVRPDRCIHHA